jgi:hypothetical protein
MTVGSVSKASSHGARELPICAAACVNHGALKADTERQRSA